MVGPTMPAAMSLAMEIRRYIGNSLSVFLMVFLSVPPSAYSVMRTRTLPSLYKIPMNWRMLGWFRLFSSCTCGQIAGSKKSILRREETSTFYTT